MKLGLYQGIRIIFVLLIGVILSPCYAATRTVDLTVAYKTVNFAGKSVQAIAVNNQIPGPTLHFNEGDTVTIIVHNQLDQGTTIHWHGLLLPWQMDGVEGVSQPPIPSGGVFRYHFTLKQAGTYWYHAHAGLQEQQGLYGAFIIAPRKPERYHYQHDQVIVLSDWSNTKPDQIYANLKKEGDYYSARFPLQPSLLHFLHDYQHATPAERNQIITDYKMMQQMRMSIYDMSDVAYDAFLLNGQSNAQPWTTHVKVGETVRLRFIGAGADTIFHVKIPGATLHVIQVQGQAVVPYSVTDFTLAPGETVDALVKITQPRPTIIYAEAADTLGAAYGALVTQPDQAVDYQQVPPFPTPAPVTRSGMAGMAMPDMPGMSSQPMAGMAMGNNMAGMSMPSSPLTVNQPSEHSAKPHEGMSSNKSQTTSTTVQTTGTPYQSLRSLTKTNDPTKPVHIINMVLSGYMDRYVWFINGVPEAKASPILIVPGQRYRLVFTNASMMHHPMHLHGHFFILRNGHGAYDPLLHTIDVPPGATAVADFDADASGQWIFHCHFLYHMMSGMTRVFRYTTFPTEVPHAMNSTTLPTTRVKSIAATASPPNTVSPAVDPHMLGNHPMGHAMGLFGANYVELAADPWHGIQELSWKSLIGNDDHKLELYTEDAEIDKGHVDNTNLDVFYWHPISEFWAIKGGVNYVYRPASTPYWQPGVGIEGLMPYFIDTNIRTYWHAGNALFNLEFSRDSQLTNNVFLRTGIRSQWATRTVAADEIGSGLNQWQIIIRPYIRLMPGLALYTEFNHTQDQGALRTLRQQANEAATQNTISLGLSILF